jgi:hypothetical protein
VWASCLVAAVLRKDNLVWGERANLQNVEIGTSSQDGLQPSILKYTYFCCFNVSVF